MRTTVAIAALAFLLLGCRGPASSASPAKERTLTTPKPMAAPPKLAEPKLKAQSATKSKAPTESPKLKAQSPAKPKAPRKSPKPKALSPAKPKAPKKSPKPKALSPAKPKTPRKSPKPKALSPAKPKAPKKSPKPKALSAAKPKESPKISILRGLLAQRERRIAGILRELAAARSTARSERLVASQAFDRMEQLQKKTKKLERQLALSRGGVKASPTKPSVPSASDPRFAPGGSLDPQGVIAKLDGEPVRRADFLETLYYTYGLDYYRSFLRVRLVAQEAKRQHIAISERERISWAAKQLARLSATQGGDDRFAKRLKAEGKSLALVEAMLRKNASFALLVEKLIAQRRGIPAGKARLEKTARAQYDQQYGKTVKAAHIFWHLKPDAAPFAWEQAMKHAQQVRRSIVSGNLSFAAAAKRESDDQKTKDAGGLFGPVARSEYASTLPVFNGVMFSLPQGQISPPVRSKVGVHLVRVVEIVPPALSWAEAKPGILRKIIADGPSVAETDALLMELQGSTKIERSFKLD